MQMSNSEMKEKCTCSCARHKDFSFKNRKIPNNDGNSCPYNVKYIPCSYFVTIENWDENMEHGIQVTGSLSYNINKECKCQGPNFLTQVKQTGRSKVNRQQ